MMMIFLKTTTTKCSHQVYMYCINAPVNNVKCALIIPQAFALQVITRKLVIACSSTMLYVFYSTVHLMNEWDLCSFKKTI